MKTPRIVIIGAGIGGLVAAVELARQGVEVALVEKAAAPGGKMRALRIADKHLDAGPTVFTLRHLFEDIFQQAGTTMSDHVTLQPAGVLARHTWGNGSRLDLHAEVGDSAEAIGAFAGAAEAERFRGFCRRAERIYGILEKTFINDQRPGVVGLSRRVGLDRPMDLWRISPFVTLWQALGKHFRDPRLRQLFGRYATYCGSSPFQAPATLMLVAHVEQAGVWLIDGGMHRLAAALANVAAGLGATLRYRSEVAEILVEGGRAAGVRLADGERLPADAVVLNADVAALGAGLFGQAASRAADPVPLPARSLSAITWSAVAETDGFPLSRHTVFFSNDYRAEFDDIFHRRRPPGGPTVYVCAQDRDDAGTLSAPGPERLLILTNAPALGDRAGPTPAEIAACQAQTFGLLERCGLTVRTTPETTVVTTPVKFNELFPATGGALYGRASHGWMASFRRPGARSRLPGLYLAGGSTHPGPGVPMAAISGRLAAASLVSDLSSTDR